MAGSVGVQPCPHPSMPRLCIGRMSDIGTIEDASGVPPVPSSPTTVVASPLAEPTAVDTSSPKFPIEVFEHIIDHCCVDKAHGGYGRGCIRGDRKTLLACALTCKAWLPRSRFQLLRRVAFWRTSQAVAFSRMLNAYPDMASLVQCLNVCRKRKYPRGKPEWPTEALMVLARRMPVLRCLVFQVEIGRDDNISFDRRLIMCISEFPALTSLSIYNVTLPSVYHLGRLLLAIPALRILDCRYVRVKKDGFDDRGLPPQMTRLRLTSVKLKRCAECIVDLVVATSTCEHIKALDVDWNAAHNGAFQLLRQ